MLRILVVDDEPDVVEFLRQFLSQRGYEVAAADDAEGALRQLAEDPPHLMLLDVKMPGVDGLEILRRAKARCPRLRVIMITGLHEEEVAREALRLGADDYITKPIDLGYLELSVLARVLNRLGK